MENLINIAKNRFAANEYNTKVIPNETLQYIFDITCTAPTSFNLGHWRILNVKSMDIRKKFAPAFLKSNATKVIQASNLILFITKTEAAFNKNEAWLRTMTFNYLKRIDETYKTNNADKEGALDNMLKIVLTGNFGNNDNNLTEWSKRQAYIALGYMLLAAKEKQIDSTPMEGFSKEKLVEMLLESNLIMEDETVAITCVLGYTDGTTYPELGPKIKTHFFTPEKVKTI